MGNPSLLRRRVVQEQQVPVVTAKEDTASFVNSTSLLVNPSVEEILSKATLREVKPTSEDCAATRAQIAQRAKKAIDAQLKLISVAEVQVDIAHAKIEQAYKIIDAQMRQANIEIHTDGAYVAELTENFTRQQRDVDPKIFKNRVSNDVFWASIEVIFSKALQHITDAELTEMATIIPAKSTGITLKIKRVGSKKLVGAKNNKVK